MKSFKIKVYNETISKAVQEKLFSLGYKWPISGKNLSYLNHTAIFSREGILGSVSADSDSAYNGYNYFYDDDREELTINQLMEMEPEHKKKIEKLNVKIGDLIDYRRQCEKIDEIISFINNLADKCQK